MAVARLRFLDRGEEELVHATSLKWLENIGVMVKSQKVLAMLQQAGASVDNDKGIAKIPESMVKDAVSKAPKRIVLGARDPKNEKVIPVDSWPLMTTTGLAVYTYDIDTGEKRPTTAKDLANFSRVADAMDAVDIVWTTVTAGDVRQDALALHSLWTTLRNCTKHIHVIPTPKGAEEAKRLVDLGALVAGGPEQLRRKPLFSVISCPIAPLEFEKASIEGQVEYSKAGVPVVCMSMSLSGMSAPVTTCGTLVNINAENLASLVISQTAAPGAPFVYSSESAPIDMTTGIMDYASHNLPMIASGASQMAKRYGLPSQTGNWGIETKVPGVQASFTELLTTALASMSGSDMVAGAGSCDAAKGAALEQVVIDSYLWLDCRKYMTRFEISEASAATEVVEAVGHGNTFLKHMHTVRNFKKELIFRDQQWKGWQATLSTSMVPEAKAIAKKVLAEHAVPDVDPEVARKGDAIVAAHTRTLGV
ncbi:MAG: trimethylamine methyltransferase family protein [Thermoplasmata archaeon]